MKQAAVIIGAIVVIVIVGGATYLLTRDNSADSDTTTTSNHAKSPATTKAADTATVQSNLTITFTNNGFDKSSYTVKSGSVVTVKNDSTMKLQFSSGSHPTHREDPEINMGVLAPGESGTFTAVTKGEHSFHDHIHDEYTGTLVVE